MMIGDYDELAARSFDEPYDPELRDAMLVCADALVQANDPRGPLITMEHALEDAEPRRALELRRAMHEHVIEHGAMLLGAVASLMSFKRALSLEWRAGRLYGVLIDARYIVPKAKIAPGELVKLVLKSPAARTLRRLRVRIRRPSHVVDVIAMLAKRKRPLPLEELEVGARVWPRQIDQQQGRSYTVAPAYKLLEKYPNLYYLAVHDVILPLPIGDATEQPEQHIPEVLLVDPPTSLAPRVMLGRALTSLSPELRAAAFQRITGIGPAARVFSRVMNVLLQPGVSEPQLPIVAGMRALGPARETLSMLAKVASRVGQYDVATRRAAGAAAAVVRAALTPG